MDVNTVSPPKGHSRNAVNPLPRKLYVNGSLPYFGPGGRRVARQAVTGQFPLDQEKSTVRNFERYTV